MAKKLSKKTKPWSLFLAFGFLLLALLFVGSLYAAYHPKLLVSKIVVDGNKTVSDFEIRQVINEKLAAKFLGLYPKRHALLYPREEVKTALAKTFPRLATITLSQPNLRELDIAVTERHGDYLWCVSDDDCFFADDTGFVFSPAPQFSSPLYFEFVSASSSNPIGQYPLPSTDFQKLIKSKQKLAAVLDNSLFADDKIFRVAPGEMRDWNFQVAVSDSDANWWEVRVDLNQDSDLAISTLASVLADQDFIKEAEGEHGRPQYLDLRFAPKVFYRYNTK